MSWTPTATHYPPMPRRKQRGETAEKDVQTASQRDAPVSKETQLTFQSRLVRWASRWGADLLLLWGAGCISAGVGWIYPPAGLIAAGVLLIAGGVLWARGGDGP